ncbi:MAG: bifunctional folylpolyglutamate synthase/dihydrofolate synthase [Victivallaceae bacterium]|nr:bifunctional folylpolyglutamate synthase/dihydrofolate synthase [Victivallaceae bacterium]
MNPANRQFLDSLARHGMKPGLEATQELMAKAGNPAARLQFVHIAGTNGKGSVGAMLERTLRAAGLSTGFYATPEMIDVRECFRVNGQAVGEADFDDYCAELRKVCDGKCSLFEFTTVLAALIFARAGVDVAVWETGMGGRLDATNVVTPLATVITNIALDHRSWLGDTIEEIAAEKAGIIKPGVPLFAGVMPEAALRVIEARAHELGSPVLVCGGDAPEAVYDLSGGGTVQRFEFEGARFALPLAGRVQRYNFMLTQLALKWLAPRLHIDLKRADAGFARVVWPGRCQRIGEKLIVDGAHNPDGLGALRDTLSEMFPGEKFVFVFGSYRDKDAARGLAELAPIASEMVFVPLHGARRPAFEPEELVKLTPAGVAASTSTGAVEAVRQSLAAGRRTVGAGSFVLAGELLHALCGDDSTLDL